MMQKHLLSAVALLATTGALYAGSIVNGDFSSNTITVTGTSPGSAQSDDGWYTFTNAVWSISGGTLSRDGSLNPGTPTGVGQIWENDTDGWYDGGSKTAGATNFTLDAGSYNLNLTYDFNDALGDDMPHLQLWSYDFIAPNSSGFQFSNVIQLSNDSSQPVTADRYTVTNVVDVTLAETTGSQTISIGFTLGAGQEFMGIRIASTLDAGDTLSFTNIDITPVPEPSTYALIAGLGVVGLLAIRRRK